MTGIPPQAITAAAFEICDDHCTSGCRDKAQRALEAAAPFLAEDRWDAARDRATEANDARRDERERCAQLAESVKAVATADEGTQCYFADLLREAQP